MRIFFFSRESIAVYLLTKRLNLSTMKKQPTKKNKQAKANLFQKHRHMEQKPLVDQVAFR